MKKLGLYVHIPFCIQKCNYCDFCSFPEEKEQIENYINALLDEMLFYQKAVSNYVVDTAFIGGGTPTAISKRQLLRVIDGLKTYFSVLPDAEITVEANPKTASFDYFSSLNRHGVNRISLGAQSFCEKELNALGRVHGVFDIEKSVSELRQAGFSNFNLDLMMGIPYQSMESLQRSLERAIALQPAHLSLYSLIIEEGTPFGISPPDGLPDEDMERSMYHMAVSYLKEAGYFQYEISNFSKPEYMCRHNIKYWQCEEYLGLGLAAHSQLFGMRFSNTKAFTDYCTQTNKVAEKIVLSEQDKIGEYMMLGLRMLKGVNRQTFYSRFYKTLDSLYGSIIQKHCANGLLLDDGCTIRLTERGLDLSNYVMCDFLE